MLKNLTEYDFEVETINTPPILPRIHLLIPIYNEGVSILRLIDRICNALDNKVIYKITIIDDGSTDNIIDFIDQSLGIVNIIENMGNCGKGVSLIKGFNQTSADELVITMDGDGEHLPEDIFALIEPILNGKVKACIGTRFDDNRFFRFFNQKSNGTYSNNGKPLNFLRSFGNWLFSLAIWVATQTWVDDTQNGFRAFAPGVVQDLKLDCQGFQIETEITMNLINNCVDIENIPIQTGRVGRPSYMEIFKDSLKNLITIFRLKLPKKIDHWICRILPIIVRK